MQVRKKKIICMVWSKHACDMIHMIWWIFRKENISHE